MIALLLILLALLQPDPQFRAQWDTSTSATVSWHQTTRSCLYAKSGAVFVGCWEGSGRVVVEFGHEGSLSGDLRPVGGDVYVLESGGQKERAPLRGRAVYLAAWRG